MELGENFVGHGYIIDRSRAVRFINVLFTCIAKHWSNEESEWEYRIAERVAFRALALARSHSVQQSEQKGYDMMERWTVELILKMSMMLMLFAILHALWTYQISRVKISIEYTK